MRALEHAASADGRVRAGDGVATERVGPDSRLRVVDLVLSGTHEANSSHYQLLRAFVDDETLEHATAALDERGYRTHEFGDSVLIARRSHDTVGQPFQSWCRDQTAGLKGPRYDCDDQSLAALLQ